MCELRREWLLEFAREPPTRLTIARIRDKFEADVIVHDVKKQISGRTCTATSPASSAMVLEQFTPSPQSPQGNVYVRQELSDQVYN
jgi:predicted GNAT family acetyltransferase